MGWKVKVNFISNDGMNPVILIEYLYLLHNLDKKFII